MKNSIWFCGETRDSDSRAYLKRDVLFFGVLVSGSGNISGEFCGKIRRESGRAQYIDVQRRPL